MILGLTLAWIPLVIGCPVNTMAVVVMFTMFLLREIEGSLAEVGHITMSDDEETVSWRLPASKTDPQAKGCTRSWGCTCLTPHDPARECRTTLCATTLHISEHISVKVLMIRTSPYFPRLREQSSKAMPL